MTVKSAKTPKAKFKESDLYPPVKELLMQQGYQVKGEVKGCDVVAKRGDELLAVELKLQLNLVLLMQANGRADMVDHVYIAIPKNNAVYRKHRRKLLQLLRRVGCGLIVVGIRFKKAEAVLDPGPYTPRLQKKKRARLLKEFHDLVGDPNAGGSANTVRKVTVYRQKAVQISKYLQSNGVSKASVVRDALQIENAREIMYHNHYGWFDRSGKGMYALSPKGHRELPDWQIVVFPAHQR